MMLDSPIGWLNETCSEYCRKELFPSFIYRICKHSFYYNQIRALRFNRCRVVPYRSNLVAEILALNEHHDL